MSYRRRRGLGGGRGAKGGERTSGSPPEEQASGDAPEQRDLPDGTAAAAAAPRTQTLSELFSREPEPQVVATRGGRRWGRWLISAAVVAAFFGGGYLAAAQWVFPGGRVEEDSSLVQVPELVGLTEDEAQGRLERLELEYTVRSHRSGGSPGRAGRWCRRTATRRPPGSSARPVSLHHSHT